MSTPEVSVVMSVFNGGGELAATLESVLSQEGVDLELVVVDDGSTDATAAVLAGYAARDARVRVLTQENRGLTRALIRGCAEARGELIARQDAGDRSLPGRLRLQRDLLASDAGLDFVACGWELIGPEGEPLAEERGEERSAATARLRHPDEKTLGNPPHPTVMFRCAAYEAAGGYRAEFAVGQDVDLWVRLAQRGDLAYVPEILYQVRFSLGGISARRFAAQRELRRLIVASARARARGEAEAAILAEAAAIGAAGATVADPARGRAAAAYFVGCLLRQRRDPRAGAYFREAVRLDPFHARGWVRLAQAALRRRGAPTGAPAGPSTGAGEDAR